MHPGIGTTTILRARPRPARSPQAPRRAGAAYALFALLAATVTPTAATETLTPQERVGVLSEASAAFEEGISLKDSDPAAAVDAFATATRKYQALIDSGVHNGRLYYNLGNAELQQGRLGPAILNYRRAAQLTPGDRRLMSSLKFARSLCRSQIPERGGNEFLRTLFFLHYELSMRTRLLASLAAYVAFWLVALVGLFVKRFRTGRWAALLAVIWVSFGASVLIQWQFADRRPAGVIMADDVIARKGNGLNYEQKFKEPLHEGVEFVVLETRGDWWHIELPDGKTGWVQADRVERV